MRESLNEQMAGIAKSVAMRYHARCWWADLEDLEQQAWVVVLEVLRWYFPETDMTEEEHRRAFGQLAYTATMRQLSRYLWLQQAPVFTVDHDVRALRDARRAPLRGHARDAVGVDLEDGLPDPESLFIERESLVRRYATDVPAVRDRMRELYCRLNWGRQRPDALLDATCAIYLEGLAPKEAADRFEVDVNSVYRTTEIMRGMMRADRKLRGSLEALRDDS